MGTQIHRLMAKDWDKDPDDSFDKWGKKIPPPINHPIPPLPFPNQTNETTIAILEDRLKHLEECESILEWLDKEAGSIAFKNGVNWYEVQWSGLGGLQKCLAETKSELEKRGI